MESFDRENLRNIKAIFQERTGVELPGRSVSRRPLRTALVLAAVIGCLVMTVAASSLFSSLSGDELAFSAAYEGNGVVSIRVENRSDKELIFQPKLKLMRWNTGQEVEPVSGGVVFDGSYVAPHSSGVMTVDLSAAYDVEELERPLTDDHYYLVLTNNGFAFGQDWMCSVDFAEPATVPAQPSPSAPAGGTAEGVEESLRFYFEADLLDTGERRAMTEEYVQAYTRLFEEFEGNIIPSVSPVLPGNKISFEIPYLVPEEPGPDVIFDDSVPPEEQYLLVGRQWHSMDPGFRLLATEGEYAMVLSVALPMEKYKDATVDLPLFYFLTYEKAAADGEAYAFICGRLLSFEEMEEYQVYGDDQYVCYEVSGLIYSDLGTYVERYAAQNSLVRLDEQTKMRVENIYHYYKENLVLSYR